jgi:hypothetical protein
LEEFDMGKEGEKVNQVLLATEEVVRLIKIR